jgi:hypothetical protein
VNRGENEKVKLLQKKKIHSTNTDGKNYRISAQVQTEMCGYLNAPPTIETSTRIHYIGQCFLTDVKGKLLSLCLTKRHTMKTYPLLN